MKYKIFATLIIGIMVSINVSSQTIRENIDKLAKDKKTQEERAGKADVFIHKKIITNDTTQVTITPKKVVTKPTAVKNAKYKMHKYKKKYKTSSK